jgi:putative transcriptional regulator
MKRSKTTAAGRKIIGALRELVDHAKTGRPTDEKFTVRTVSLAMAPKQYRAADVRALRDRMSMSQALFAKFLGTGVKTVQSWEQGLRKPTPMARRFFDEIERELSKDPDYGRRRIKEAGIVG